MYDLLKILMQHHLVTGPCEFLVMYDLKMDLLIMLMVTGPCEFLVMYDANCNNTYLC